MTQSHGSEYEAWADKILNDSLAADRDELRRRIVAMFSQAHQNGRREGRKQEIVALGIHLSQRCGGGNITIPSEIGSPVNPIDGDLIRPVKKEDSKENPRKIPVEEVSALYLKLMSDDPSSAVDLIVKVERGAKFSVVLPHRDKDGGFFMLPGNIPQDQRCLVSQTGGGLRCRSDDDDWDPPWGYEDEGMGWKPGM